MSLTEFLLARIAGREAAINFAREHGFAFPALSPAEMLAECVAKRELVTGDSAITFAEREGRGPSELHRYVMRTLALPYADHPDYDETWRP